MPLFQNKVYPSEQQALLAESGSLLLYVCRECGFVWNARFEAERLQYDSQYQNEQSHSDEFKRHLVAVRRLVEEKYSKISHIVEIGCGKGTFLTLLRDAGYSNLSGFDPAYEGADPFIKKSYYPPDDEYARADLFIMRHVLEHIPDPLHFLKGINDANGAGGGIYIEVPDFTWIARVGAFWDISYEHCNYFSHVILESILPNCKVGYLFGDQYLYAIGNFTLRSPGIGSYADVHETPDFEEKLEYCRWFVSERSNVALWGAGAKGANFARMIDPNRENIRCIVDINPKKQGRYIAGSAHPIVSPEVLGEDNNVESIIIMNENYAQEVKSLMESWNGEFFVLDKQLMKV